MPAPRRLANWQWKSTQKKRDRRFFRHRNRKKASVPFLRVNLLLARSSAKPGAAPKSARTESSGTTALGLRKRGLLVRSQDLIKGRISFGVTGAELGRQAADRGCSLIDGRAVVALHSVVKALVRGLQVGAHRSICSGGVGEDRRSLLLLGCGERQLPGQKVHLALRNVRGRRRITRRLGEGYDCCK